MRKVLLIGDSHIHAIQAALEERNLVPPELNFEALRLGSPEGAKVKVDVTIDGAVEKVKLLSADFA